MKTEGVMGGKARIADRRMSASQIRELCIAGADTPEEIADQLDQSLAEVHAALSYCYDHPEGMEAIRQRNEALESGLEARSKAPEELQR